MGRRGTRAAFMPSKHVFPGGAVDTGDAAVPLAAPLAPEEAAALAAYAATAPRAIAAAAIRELWEEAGLRLALPGDWPAPPGWRGFAAGGHVPTAAPLRFVFRALTPPGRPRRFDARFLLADAAALIGDPDDFSAAGDEALGPRLDFAGARRPPRRALRDRGRPGGGGGPPLGRAGAGDRVPAQRGRE